MTADPLSPARARLERILADSAQAADRLRCALRAERTALENNDADALDAATSAKADPLARLAALDAERVAVGRDAGLAQGAGTMKEIIDACDEDSVLANGWGRLLEIARDCERLNAVNGAIVRLRRQQVMAGLMILRGSELDHDTYAASGIEAHSAGGRALAQA